MFYVCWMDFNGPRFIVYQWICRFLSRETWKVGTIHKAALCHWAPRSLCNNTWCVTLVQAVPPFLNAWTEPNVAGRHWGVLKGGWQEGCLGGSDLPSFHFSPLLHSSLYLSFLLLSLPSSFHPNDHFLHSSLFCTFFFSAHTFILLKILFFLSLSRAGL